MPTQRQFDLLCFIRGQMQSTGVTPSYDEMALGVGLRSKSGVPRLLAALERQGYILWQRRHARSIEVIKWPQDEPKRILEGDEAPGVEPV